MAEFDYPDRGHLVRLDDGSFVERDVLNVIQKIMEYDPNIKVQYLEYAANLNEAPWRVVELCRDGQWRTIFYCWTLDDRVLHRLRMADTNVTDVQGNLESNNERVRREHLRRYRDRMEHAEDIVSHILASPKGRYSFDDPDTGNRVMIDDDPLRQHKVIEKD
jgi:hypothetical protein